MSGTHIYRAKDQPATRYIVCLSDEHRFVVRSRRRTQFQCFHCKCRRWATYLVAHVYYDGTYFFCRKGRGCKSKT